MQAELEALRADKPASAPAPVEQKPKEVENAMAAVKVRFRPIRMHGDGGKEHGGFESPCC